MNNNEKDVLDLFGGADRIVNRVTEMVSTLCTVRGWSAEILATRAFPATARAAEGQPDSQAHQEFARIKSVARSLMDQSLSRLPSQRFVLSFLDALGAPLQTVLTPQNLSDEDRKYWAGSLKERGMDAGFSSTGKLPPESDATSLELLLALDALTSVCEPEPAPTESELQRRHRTRDHVRGILGLSARTN